MKTLCAALRKHIGNDATITGNSTGLYLVARKLAWGRLQRQANLSGPPVKERGEIQSSIPSQHL